MSKVNGLAKRNQRVNRKDLTTGIVASALKVAPRTVSKWVDGGRLEGYRIPYSHDRRITRESLAKFVNEHGMPWPAILDKPEASILVFTQDENLRANLTVNLLSIDGLSLAFARTHFEAGCRAHDMKPGCLLVDCSTGRHEALLLARMIQQHLDANGRWPFSRTVMAAIMNADETNEAELTDAGFTWVFRRPVDADGLAVALLKIVGVTA